MKDKVILGLSLGHDASATVIRNGEIISHILRERHSGYRHHYGLDYNTIALALKESSISIEDIDYCAVTATQQQPALINDKSFFSFTESNLNPISLKNIFPILPEREKKQSNTELSHIFCGQIEFSEWQHESDRLIIERIDENIELKNNRVQKFFKECEDIRKIPKFVHNDWELIFYVSPVYGPKSWKSPFKLRDLPSKLQQFIGDRALEANLYRPIEVLIKDNRIPGFFIFHHLAHAASSYYSSPFETSLIFTHDGGGGLESGFIFIGDQNSIFPIGPHYLECGQFYEYIGHRCGFDLLGCSGKLMGLSSYGQGQLDNILPIGTVYDWLAWEKEHLNEHNTGDPYNSMLNALLLEADRKGIDRTPFGDKEAVLSEVTKEIAYATQKLTERTVSLAVQNTKESLQTYGYELRNLCFSGGVALNCPTNSCLWNKNIFQKIHIEPHCEDGGLSIGASQFVFFNILGQDRQTQKKKNSLNSQYAMLGINHSEDEIEAAIQKYKDYINYEKERNWTRKAAQDLSVDLVIGVYQGKSETGPRALGHRSIFANPSFKRNWARVNSIKVREQWRPFAPVILQEDLSHWFEAGPPSSPFMLFTYRVKDEKRNSIPAVTHVDQTSRVQTVVQEDGDIYSLLKNFKKITSIPLILNTSFNGPGKPIVESPESAIEFFLSAGLSVLYLNHYRIQKKN